jgi:hypothetical protein
MLHLRKAIRKQHISSRGEGLRFLITYGIQNTGKQSGSNTSTPGGRVKISYNIWNSKYKIAMIDYSFSFGCLILPHTGSSNRIYRIHKVVLASISAYSHIVPLTRVHILVPASANPDFQSIPTKRSYDA